jgi:hypothetical protein
MRKRIHLTLASGGPVIVTTSAIIFLERSGQTSATRIALVDGSVITVRESMEQIDLDLELVEETATNG